MSSVPCDMGEIIWLPIACDNAAPAWKFLADRCVGDLYFGPEPRPVPGVTSAWVRLWIHLTQEFSMTSTTDKLKGLANEATGTVKQAVGKAVGNDRLQAEGAVQKNVGLAQEAVGKAKDAVKKAIDGV